jgi:hypothetical protein
MKKNLHLVRDASNDIIKLEQSDMKLHDGESARKCFVTAQTLELQANATDTLHPLVLTRFKLLEGDNGLIQQAHNLQ